jgi:hypothetical protein
MQVFRGRMMGTQTVKALGVLVTVAADETFPGSRLIEMRRTQNSTLQEDAGPEGSAMGGACMNGARRVVDFADRWKFSKLRG